MQHPHREGLLALRHPARRLASGLLHRRDGLDLLLCGLDREKKMEDKGVRTGFATKTQYIKALIQQRDELKEKLDIVNKELDVAADTVHPRGEDSPATICHIT